MKSVRSEDDIRIYRYISKKFHENGWELEVSTDIHDKDEFYTYTIVLHEIIDSDVKVYAEVVNRSEHLRTFNGEYGVHFVRVEFDNYDYPLHIYDLENLQENINAAEKNLLLIGAFASDYRFTKDIAHKKRRNASLRKKLNLEEIEKKEHEKRIEENKRKWEDDN